MVAEMTEARKTLLPLPNDRLCKNCNGDIVDGVCTVCNFHAECCGCGLVRSEYGTWFMPEVPIAPKNTSHTFCPHCLDEQYRELRRNLAERKRVTEPA